jgi:cytochrome c oxidase assembly protein subunit 15
LSALAVFARTRASTPGTPAPVRAATWRWQIIGTTVYVLLVVYLGAYVRHAGISLACADWPLCNGQVVPSLEGPTAFVFAHRLAALGALGLLAWLALRGERAASLALALGIVQALSGALVVWTRLGLFSTLAHAAIMAMLFAVLAQLLREALFAPRTTGQTREPSRRPEAVGVGLANQG